MADRKSWLDRLRGGSADKSLNNRPDMPAFTAAPQELPAAIAPIMKQESPEQKELREKLEATIGELKDAMSEGEVKFLDTEPSGFNTHYNADYSGIDQQLDASALQRMYTTETWVYTAVTEIAKTIASLPQKLEKRKRIKQQVKNQITNQMEEVEKDVWIDASSEKLFTRFEFPNRWTSKVEWLMLLTIDLLTAGEFFIYLDSDIDLTTISAGDDVDLDNPFARLQRAMTADCPIKQMYRIPPPLIKPIPSIDKSYIEGYAMQSDKGVFAFNFAEIIHVKLPNPNDPFRGLSPLVAAFKPVLLDRFSTEHMVRFYKTGARLGGVIETQKSLNKEQLGRFQRSFEASFTGRKNHHRTLILPPGMTYKQIEQNPAETALLEFCRYNREAILSVYHVPPIKVGIMDNANYANARVQLQIFFEDTIKPLLTFISGGYTYKNSLMPGGNTYRHAFDLSNVEALKEDLGALADTAQKMLKGALTVNEVRERVWKAAPLANGDRCFNIAEIDKMENGQSGALIDTAAGAPIADTQKEGSGIELDASGLTPPQITAAMNILGRVRRERITAEAGVELMVSTLSIPRALACRLCGLPEPIAPDAGKDGLNTSDQGALVPTAVGTGAPKKPGESCDKCKKDPCVCPPEDKGGKPRLGQFIDEAIAQLDSSEKVTPELISELTAIFYDQHPDEKFSQSAPTAEDKMSGPTKEMRVSEWKGLVEKTEPLIAKRQEVLAKWFRQVHVRVMNRVGANIKSFGLAKAVDEDDVKNITDTAGFDDLIKEYVKQIDAALKAAYEQGYVDTLVKFEFSPPNEKALEFLKQYGATEVKYILDTTMEQMRTLLSDAFEKEATIGEVAIQLQEKFDEISAGRANTIARTEVLTAVSQGQEQKAQDFKEQFPDRKLMKMWVSAQDDKVRDSHQDVDGESVDIDEDFSNGLKYPRQPGAPAEEVINCRCTKMTYAEEDEGDVQESLPATQEATDNEE